MPSEQPDRHDEHARRAGRVLRAGPRARADRPRPGVLRVHRRPRATRTGSRSTSGGATACSSCGRSRRSTGSPGCASGGASGAARSSRRSRRFAARSTSTRRRRSQPLQASTITPRSSDADASTRRSGRASSRSSSATASRACPAVANFVYAESGEEDASPLFEALLRAGVIVRPLAGLRGSERDPRHGRVPGGQRCAGRGARPRPRGRQGVAPCLGGGRPVDACIA